VILQLIVEISIKGITNNSISQARQGANKKLAATHSGHGTVRRSRLVREWTLGAISRKRLLRSNVSMAHM